jgi:6-carboxyhexanoate--CoA ligase
MIDEAHATGVIGPGGHGTVAHFGLTEGPDITLGTLSKALGGEGGFVCGRRLLCDYLRNRARGFIFTTAMSPVTAAVARAALRVLQQSPELPQRLATNVKVFVDTLRERGIVTSTQSAIVPIPVGDERRAVEIAARLQQRGIFLSAIRYPTVALGQARLRASILATHSPEELRHAAQVIAEELQPVIIQNPGSW